jgi:protein-tyrosine phosphatase
MYRDHTSHGNDWNRVHEIGRYYNNWGKQTIVHRHAFIALWATERWKMDCSCDSKPDEEDMRILESLDELHPIFYEENGDKDWYKPESVEETIVDQEDELEEDLAADDETLVVTEEQESPDYEPFEDDLLEVEMEIPADTGRNVWVEKTKTEKKGKEIPDRTSGPKALGRAIWSPQESKSGQDIYAEMRDVSKGDLIIHLVNNSTKDTYISGVSVVRNDGVIEETDVQWGDQKGPGYKHELESYIKLREPIYRPYLLSEENREEMNEIRQEGKVFYTANMQLRQGHYLTPCVPKLADLINQICKQVNNSPLPHFGEQQTSDITSTVPKITRLDQESVKAVETYYGGDANFGPAWPDDTIVFGSERPGYHDGSKVKQTRVESWTRLMKAKGINRVVCLLHPDGKLKRYEHLEGGLEGQYISHFGSGNVLMAPIPDYDISTKENIKNIVDFLEQSERLELPVVVHCSAGSGRTGHVLSVWRNYHWDVEKNKALKQSDWNPANRWPKEALGKISKHLGREIDGVDYYDLMNAVRKDEEE